MRWRPALSRRPLALALALGTGCAAVSPAPPRPAPEPGRPGAAADGRSIPTLRGGLAREAPPAARPASDLIWPVRGRILSGFGSSRGKRSHEGIDIKAPRGTTVRAAAAGRVVESRWRRGYGNVICIDHGGGLQTRYAHLEKFWVMTGARVAKGDPIGSVGATGNATTPHLHFEVRREGRARNPLAWMPPAAGEAASVPAAMP